MGKTGVAGSATGFSVFGTITGGGGAAAATGAGFGVTVGAGVSTARGFVVGGTCRFGSGDSFT